MNDYVEKIWDEIMESYSMAKNMIQKGSNKSKGKEIRRLIKSVNIYYDIAKNRKTAYRLVKSAVKLKKQKNFPEFENILRDIRRDMDEYK